MIRTQKGSKLGVSYSIQKDYDLWELEPKKVHEPKRVPSGTQEGSDPNPIGGIQKIKDNTIWFLGSIIQFFAALKVLFTGKL